MVRASKKEEPVSDQPTEEEEERRRLKKLLFSRNLYSKGPSKANSALAPSKLVAKHHGRDIVKKSQRKNRFLFSFPGLLAPVTGGKIGELKDLETKNPILYLDFPQGQMKLFGTIVYPKNRYLTLQFSRGGKNVTCEDYFDNMIVFSDAWWIGRKTENPEELRLEFPKDLNEERHAEYDFKGGAGATCEEKPGANKSGKEHVEPHSPRVNVEDDASGDSSPLTVGVSKNLLELTPIRQSARTAGKKLKYAETASEDDSVESDDNVTEGTKKIDTEKTDHAAFSSPLEENCDSSSKDITRCNMNAAAMTDLAGNNQSSSISVKKLKEFSLHKRGPLVQATIATLFEKVEEKKSAISVKRSSPRRVFGQKSRHIDLKQKSNQLEDEQPRKKGEVAKKKKTGSESTTKQQSQKQQAQVVDDEIEEFSSELEDSDGSDEDWAA